MWRKEKSQKNNVFFFHSSKSKYRGEGWRERWIYITVMIRFAGASLFQSARGVITDSLSFLFVWFVTLMKPVTSD